MMYPDIQLVYISVSTLVTVPPPYVENMSPGAMVTPFPDAALPLSSEETVLTFTEPSTRTTVCSSPSVLTLNCVPRTETDIFPVLTMKGLFTSRATSKYASPRRVTFLSLPDISITRISAPELRTTRVPSSRRHSFLHPLSAMMTVCGVSWRLPSFMRCPAMTATAMAAAIDTPAITFLMICFVPLMPFLARELC